MMQILAEEPYFYTVYRDEQSDGHFLEVTCGTVAIFLLRIKLNRKEIAQFQENPETIRVLAYRVMDSPDSFLHRRV
jgi:hypothetical protein